MTVLTCRQSWQWGYAKYKGERFEALDRPAYLDRQVEGHGEYADSDEIHEDSGAGLVTVDHKGKFF